MMQWWNAFCLAVGDPLLGWSLRLPSDATLLAVAVLSAVVFALARLATTNQDRLRRAAADKKRLKELIRVAKRSGDQDALARHRATQGQIGLMTLAAEIKPLLVAMAPIAILGTWCALRLEFHPPRADEPVEFAVYTPVSAAGALATLVPQAGVSCEGWIQRIEPVTDEGPPHGIAVWQIRAAARDEPYELTVRFGDKTLEHELLVGEPVYTPALAQQSETVITELRYRPLKLFGVVPGVAAIYFPPWLVGYLVLTIPLVFLLRRILKIQ